MLYSIKHDLWNSMNEWNTLLYKNLSLSFYSWKRYTVCCKFEKEMERHILREGTSSSPISSSWSQGVPKLAPHCKLYRQRWSNSSHRLRIPHSTLNSDWTLNLTVWFSYHVIPFRLHTCSTSLPWHTAIPLFTNHNMTACQSKWGHQE